MDDFNITYIGYDLEINENPLYNYNDNMANIRSLHMKWVFSTLNFKCA